MCSKATGKCCPLQGILSKMAHDTHSTESRERVCLDTEDTENLTDTLWERSVWKQGDEEMGTDFQSQTVRRAVNRKEEKPRK